MTNPDVKAFFIFTENKYLREYMISNGTFDKLSRAEQAELKKAFLVFRGYDKGVPLATATLIASEIEHGRTEVDPFVKTIFCLQ